MVFEGGGKYSPLSSQAGSSFSIGVEKRSIEIQLRRKILWWTSICMYCKSSIKPPKGLVYFKAILEGLNRDFT